MNWGGGLEMSSEKMSGNVVTPALRALINTAAYRDAHM